MLLRGCFHLHLHAAHDSTVSLIAGRLMIPVPWFTPCLVWPAHPPPSWVLFLLISSTLGLGVSSSSSFLLTLPSSVSFLCLLNPGRFILSCSRAQDWLAKEGFILQSSSPGFLQHVVGEALSPFISRSETTTKHKTTTRRRNEPRVRPAPNETKRIKPSQGNPTQLRGWW